MRNFVKAVCLAAGACLIAGSVLAAGAGEVVTPRGEGPIPKGKSGPVDGVLEANGWGDCTAPFEEDYWCSSKSTFSANPKPKKPVK